MNRDVVVIFDGHQYNVCFHEDGTVSGHRVPASSGPALAGETYVSIDEIRAVCIANGVSSKLTGAPFMRLIYAIRRGNTYFVRNIAVDLSEKTIGLQSLRSALENPVFDSAYLKIDGAGVRSLAVIRKMVPILCEHFNVA